VYEPECDRAHDHHVSHVGSFFPDRCREPQLSPPPPPPMLLLRLPPSDPARRPPRLRRCPCRSNRCPDLLLWPELAPPSMVGVDLYRPLTTLPPNSVATAATRRSPLTPHTPSSYSSTVELTTHRPPPPPAAGGALAACRVARLPPPLYHRALHGAHAGPAHKRDGPAYWHQGRVHAFLTLNH
jgi:hypothetical protein